MKIHKIARTSLALLAGLLLIVGLSGCEVAAQRAADEAERAVEDATGIRVDTPAPGEGGEPQLPEGLPAEVPVYPEAIITESTVGVEGNTNQWSAIFRTKDPHQDVADWFKSELEARGWRIDSATTMGMDPYFETKYVASIDDLDAWIDIITVDGEVEISKRVYQLIP